MKKLFVLMAFNLITFSAFAQLDTPYLDCVSKSYQEITSTKTVRAKLELLLSDMTENKEKLDEIGDKAKEVAAIVCKE